ncbi:hypothetical protein PVAP13_6KG092400 [Panicum virgatum]|uniref:Ubiquitin-like domain-containing protein n=1 Tax=Panicum virgatum TaxID=38727 RepID=A0A8T0R8D2_PANVG|nr:hypothetical protein PVAP13_6KG092400 [Panicum virgatum]
MELETTVPDLDTIATVRAMIENEEGWASRRPYLVFRGRTLQDGRTLASYGIQKNSTLSLRFGDAPEVLRGAGTPAQQQKRYSNYSRKAISFVMIMGAAYKLSASASLSIGKIAFMIAVAAIVIADILCSTKDYAYAILPVPLPITAALIHHKHKSRVRHQRTDGEADQAIDTENANEDVLRGEENNDNNTDKDRNSDDDEDIQHFDGIFETPCIVVTGGSLVAMFGGQYMVGAASPLGFFFFFTVALGLYLMTITTVRTVALTPHATYLEIVLKLLVVITIITAFFHR